MEKEEIAVLANLLSALKDIADKMEEALRKKDPEELKNLKMEALSVQVQIDKML